MSPSSTASVLTAASVPRAQDVPPALRTLFARAGRPIDVPTGTTLFAAGSPVQGLHLVLEGSVRVVRDGGSGARAVVVHRECAGGLLGEVALFSGRVYPATAVATEPTRLMLVAEADVRRALAETPALADVLLHRLAGRTREVIERLDRVVHLTIARRLALHLVDRGRRARGDVVSLGMTQSALAEELGTVKALVVRELRTLRRLRLVEPAGAGRYRIVDRDALHAYAGLDA